MKAANCRAIGEQEGRIDFCRWLTVTFVSKRFLYTAMATYNCLAPLVFERTKQLDSVYLPLSEIGKNDKIVFDLSSIKFIKPPALIGLLVLIESLIQKASNQRPNILITAPKDKHVLDYLLKINFVGTLQSMGGWKITGKMPTKISRKIRPVIPITRFKTANDIENIATKMSEIFQTDLIGLSTLLQPCHVIFSELADNVIHHAGSGGGYILAQQYSYRNGPMIDIAVGDAGIGIPSSLRNNPNLAGLFTDDKSAIILALRDQVTRFDDPYRGFGLGHIKAELGSITKRSLTIRSGTGYAIVKGSGYTFTGVNKWLPGTIAHAVIPCR